MPEATVLRLKGLFRNQGPCISILIIALWIFIKKLCHQYICTPENKSIALGTQDKIKNKKLSPRNFTGRSIIIYMSPSWHWRVLHAFISFLVPIMHHNVPIMWQLYTTLCLHGVGHNGTQWMKASVFNLVQSAVHALALSHVISLSSLTSYRSWRHQQFPNPGSQSTAAFSLSLTFIEKSAH